MAIIPKYIKLCKTYRLNVHCDNISRHWKKYDCLWYLSLPIHFQRCRIENGFSWLCCKKFAVFGCLTVKLGRPGRGGLGGQPERERESYWNIHPSSPLVPCSGPPCSIIRTIPPQFKAHSIPDMFNHNGHIIHEFNLWFCFRWKRSENSSGVDDILDQPSTAQKMISLFLQLVCLEYYNQWWCSSWSFMDSFRFRSFLSLFFFFSFPFSSYGDTSQFQVSEKSVGIFL